MALLCLSAVVGTALVWHRVHDRRLRWPARLCAIVACQVTAVLLAGVLVNDQYHFFTSWREPLGMEVHKVSYPKTAPGAQDATIRPTVDRAAKTGHGALLSLTIPGTQSGVLARTARVYLPPQYGTPAYAHRRFPVVELLAGTGGGPTTWEQELHVERIMDAGLQRGTLTPMILVMPTVTVAPPRDTECVNVSGGPQVETYLVRDVRAAILHDFRATRNPAGWAVLGYSTGGYCATNYLLRNPTIFHSAVSLSGYDKPYLDNTTGKLFATTADRDANTPSWRLANLPQPRASLLLMTSRDDPDSLRDCNAIVEEAQPPLSVDEVTLHSAGHNFSVWRAEEPTAFSWLSERLSPPLASTPTVDGLAPASK